MRKNLLLFIAALCATVAVKAETITLEPGVDKIANAIASASAGDIIELTGDADHVYTEWNHIVVDKTITLRAAEGATPLVKIHYVDLNASFEAEGIQFISHNTAYYWFQTTSGGDFNISFKSCQFTNCAGNYIYYLPKEQSINSLTIDDCIMDTATEGNNNRFLYTCGVIDNFTMINSTIMNHPGGYPCYVRKVNTSLLVDHCTFYNNGNRPLLLGDEQCPTDAVVKNCVVANPAVVDNYCIATYGGTVDNCVYYNTSAPRSSSSTNTNCINADPQFVDPDNGNFNFAFTSPLFLAATDGTNIGDPRWGVEVGEDAIDIPGTLPLDAAVLNGTKISKTAEAISWSENDTKSFASFVINATKIGKYNVVLTETTSKGHNYKVSVIDIDGSILSVAEGQDTWKSGALTLGQITIPEKGNYLVRLENLTQYSSSSISAFQFTYAGGAVVDVPASLPIEDAIINGPRVSKAEGGLKWNNSSDDASSFVTWNINVTKAGDYEVVVNENTEFGHNYSVTIENDQETLPDVGEGKDVWKSGDISLGIISIANTGVYTVKLTNTTLNSISLTNSLSLNYIGGGIVNVPGILPAEDALLGGKVIRLENGSVKWPNKSDVDNHYVTWNINATAAGDVDVIAHIGTPSSGHCFTASLYEGETLKSSVAESATVHTTGEVKLGTLNIPAAGAYTLRLTNAVEWSSAIVDALELKEAQVIQTIEIGDNQTDVDFTAYAGQTVNIKLNRTIKADMFTPFCLPFALHSGALSSVLKSDKAYVLDDAQIQDQTLSVKLQTYSSIYQGTPFLIKPTEEVVDPIFENVTIMDDPQASNTTKGNVTFQGSFAKENLTESDKVLLVGNNNTLFYPNDATPYIKSMRAYFRVNVEANKLPRFAAFVEPGNAPTEMIIVGGEAERQKGHRKVLVDGQIRIQHEGKCYSILGLER